MLLRNCLEEGGLNQGMGTGGAKEEGEGREKNRPTVFVI